jgi:hypothetical protein
VLSDHAEYFGIAPELYGSDADLMASEKGMQWI